MIDPSTPRILAESTDAMAMNNGRWQREPQPASETILDAPRQWREFAAASDRTNPDLAAEYRQLADGLERYFALKGVRT